MNAEYRRSMNQNYLVLSDGNSCSLSSYRVRMLTANQISGILPCHIENMDHSAYFYYEISSKISLKKWMEVHSVKKELLLLLFREIQRVMELLHTYLLPEHGLLLQPEWIYTDAEQSQLWFCYFPAEQMQIQDQMKTLGEELLPHLEHEDKEAVILGYAFYQKCMEEDFNALDFQELLNQSRQSARAFGSKARHPEMTEAELAEHDKILDSFFSDEEESEAAAERISFWIRCRIWIKEKIQFRRRRKAKSRDTELKFYNTRHKEWDCEQQQESDHARSFELCQDSKREQERVESREWRRKQDQAQNNEFTMTNYNKSQNTGNTDFDIADSGDNETVFLDENKLFSGRLATSSSRAKLVSTSDTHWVPGKTTETEINIESFLLEKDHYMIGKSKTAANLVIHDPAISRIQAKLSWNGMTYEIEDMNSKNGTWLNEHRLSFGSAEALSDGDELVFAGKKYRYVQG